MAQRWIRLDVAWEDCEWLDELDGTAAGCWPRLLCLVKRDGVRGRCKRPSLKVLARRWRVPIEAIETLERAAIQDEALILEGGDWIVTGWAESHEDPTATERKRRQRTRDRRRKLRRRIDEWPISSNASLGYAGLVLEYEIRRCTTTSLAPINPTTLGWLPHFVVKLNQRWIDDGTSLSR